MDNQEIRDALHSHDYEFQKAAREIYLVFKKDTTHYLPVRLEELESLARYGSQLNAVKGDANAAARPKNFARRIAEIASTPLASETIDGGTF
jgi:hypothetical protein